VSSITEASSIKHISELKDEYGPRLGAAFDDIIDVEAYEALITPYNDEHLRVRDWYLSIPAYGGRRFTSFIIASRELVVYVADNDEVVLSLENVPTAYANMKRGQVVIPSNVLDPTAMLQRGMKDTTAALVSVVNGLLIHEAAHFAKSEDTIPDLIRISAPGRSSDAIASCPIANTVANVCEDVFIENWVVEKFPSYNHFLEAVHQFYFSEEDLFHRLEMLFEEIEVIPSPRALSTMAEREDKTATEEFRFPIAGIANVFIAVAKNWRYKTDAFGPFMQKYLEMFEECIGKERIEDRSRIIYDIWKALKEDPKIYWPLSISAPSHSAFDASGRGTTICKEDLDSLIRESDKASAAPEIKRIGESLRREEARLKIINRKSDFSRIPETLTKTPTPSANKTVPDPRFASLGRLLRLSFTHNYAPGQPTKRGQVLVNTRLYRLATDQKIFSYREKRQKLGRDYEIAVLVDCSGSMAGGKIREAMQVGVGAWLSLRQARIRTILLGHTSTQPRMSDDIEYPVLYLIGMPNDSIPKILAASYSFIEGKGLHNNYDGFAILEAIKQFSNKRTKKWLFHISDGAPSGRNYSGEDARSHTAGAVQIARSKGIDVVSITIARGAYEVNDGIYGKEKNVKTDNARVLKDLVEAMFLISKGAKHGKKEKVSHS